MTKSASRYSLVGALVACIVIVSLPGEAAAAVGGGAAAARAGNYSRAGAAANGGFSSSNLGARGTTPGLDRGALQGSPMAGGGAARPVQQPARPDGAAQRPDGAGASQGDRQAARIESTSTKNVTIEGGGDCRSNCWDNGDAAKIVAGAAVVQAVSAASTQAVLPCAAAPVMVAASQYYRCGQNWYAQGYGDGGLMYMQVPPPPGH